MQVRIALLVALPLGLLLAACSRHGAPEARLAARVNGSEITVQQVAVPEPSASAGASRRGAAIDVQALDQVIDRELLVQQALKEKLDADPQVARALDEARRQVLAQAWLDHAARKAGLGAKGAKDVRAFYAETPALVAPRRIYRFRELGVAGGEGAAQLSEQVRAEVTGARDLDEVAGWLRWRNLDVSPVTGATQPAEQLPLSYLPQLARMRPGDIAVFPTATGASVVQLLQAQDAPLTEQEAAPLIEKFLAGRRKLEVAAAEAKRLRATARIEYVGDFKR